MAHSHIFPTRDLRLSQTASRTAPMARFLARHAHRASGPLLTWALRRSRVVPASSWVTSSTHRTWPHVSRSSRPDPYPLTRIRPATRSRLTPRQSWLLRARELLVWDLAQR